jgi:hypothetical protein
MNERIRELAEQAKFMAEEDINRQISYNNELKAFSEKFAELIVRECNHIIAKQAWESRTAGANGDWAEYNALSRVAGQIKEHFGVQE